MLKDQKTKNELNEEIYLKLEWITNDRDRSVGRVNMCRSIHGTRLLLIIEYMELGSNITGCACSR